MVKRLFTFGCSFTRYYWPTWADILGQEYDEFENWGNGGIGNRAILERLTECVVNNKITADDTIIIQWSDLHRFDIHKPRPELPEGWAQGGNMLTAPDFEKSWISSIWSEQSFVMHTLNFIKLSITLLESLPCTWYMTSMHDISMDLNRWPSAFKNYQPLLKHKNFLSPMDSFFSQYDFPRKQLIDIDEKPQLDEHPVPIAHYAWLAEILAPKLNKSPNEQWAIKANTVLFDHCKYYTKLHDDFEKKMGWYARKNWILGCIDTDYASSKSLQ
jgi:hypothetical protein